MPVHGGNDDGAVGRVSLEIDQGVLADADLVVRRDFDRALVPTAPGSTGSHQPGIQCGLSLRLNSVVYLEQQAACAAAESFAHAMGGGEVSTEDWIDPVWYFRDPHTSQNPFCHRIRASAGGGCKGDFRTLLPIHHWSDGVISDTIGTRYLGHVTGIPSLVGQPLWNAGLFRITGADLTRPSEVRERFWRSAPMQCVVTGGCGFIGSNLVDRLVRMGHRVLVLDDLSAGSDTRLNTAAELTVGSVTDMRHRARRHPIRGLDFSYGSPAPHSEVHRRSHRYAPSERHWDPERAVRRAAERSPSGDQLIVVQRVWRPTHASDARGFDAQSEVAVCASEADGRAIRRRIPRVCIKS